MELHKESQMDLILKRLNMLLAILEKKAGFKIGVKDVFINITGGIKIEDTAIDLAVVSAILSSNINVSVTSGTCFCAEIDLSGELRSVSNIDKRISEAERLGYKKIIVSNNSKIGYTPKLIQTVKLKKISHKSLKKFLRRRIRYFIIYLVYF